LASFCQLVGFDAKHVHDDSGGAAAAVVAVDCLLQKISHVAGHRLRFPQCRPRATPHQAANLARCHLSGAPLFLDRILSVAMPGQIGLSVLSTSAVCTAGGPLISVAMIFIGAFLNEKAVCRLSKYIHSKSSGRKNL
jgi:hypothetical protein